jgi:hypothetical protein
MTTVLITGTGTVPGPLLELVKRGSTSFRQDRADELERGTPLAVDRVVFWTATEDAAVQRLARQYVNAEAAARREVVVFVTAEQGGARPPAGLSPNELFVWPRDEDRLKMAFLTGA